MFNKRFPKIVPFMR